MNTPSKIRAFGVAGLLFPLLAAAAPSVAVIASDKCDQPTILQHAKSYRQALEARLAASCSARPTRSRGSAGPRSSSSVSAKSSASSPERPPTSSKARPPAR